MQPETKFKLKVQSFLKREFGDKIYFIKVQMVSLRGVPDIIGCINGNFFAFELKVGKNKVKPDSLQALHLSMIKQAGGIAREVTPETLEIAIEELKCLRV